MRQVLYITGNLSTTSKPKRTLTWKEISEWQLDNKYIVSGYRQEKADDLETLISLTFLHNETCNIYTHLIGTILLPTFIIIFHLSRPQFLNISTMDYTIFGIYFCSAEICLILSTLYHLMLSHSHYIERLWQGMDFLGIIILILGTLVSGVYYVFFYELSLQKLHWTIVSYLQAIQYSFTNISSRFLLSVLLLVL